MAALEAAIQRIGAVGARLDGRVKPGHEGEIIPARPLTRCASA